MANGNVKGDAVSITEKPDSLRRKIEQMRRFSVGNVRQTKDITDAYTLIDGDAGFLLLFTSATDEDITVPATLPEGWWCACIQLGAGKATFVAASGATVNSLASAAATAGQYGGALVEVVANSDGASASAVVSPDPDMESAEGLKPGTSSELTISGGVVVATGSHHSVDTQSDAASDDLDTITVTALSEGQMLVLKAEDAARVVTVKSGTGNITLSGGDFSLDSAAKRLVLQKVGSNLVEVTRSVGLQSGTAQATTSGTAFDFPIPSGAKRITVGLDGVSTNGTTALRIVLGGSGGFETSGYAGIADGPTSANHSTAFFIATSQAAAGVYHGVAELLLIDAANNTWSITSLVGRSDTTQATTKCVGTKSLSAALTQVRLTADGTDTFDAGSVNIIYQ